MVSQVPGRSAPMMVNSTSESHADDRTRLVVMSETDEHGLFPLEREEEDCNGGCRVDYKWREVTLAEHQTAEERATGRVASHGGIVPWSCRYPGPHRAMS